MKKRGMRLEILSRVSPILEPEWPANLPGMLWGWTADEFLPIDTMLSVEEVA